MAECRSSWTLLGDAPFVERGLAPAEGEAQAQDARSGQLEATFAGAVALLKPEIQAEDGAAVPCELTIEWAAPPRKCEAFKIQALASARHIEVFVEGSRRNMLGETEHGEVYLGTFRGARDPQATLFAFNEQFEPNSRDHSVLKAATRVRVKFLSLVGDKGELQLLAFRCVYNVIHETPMPTPTPDTIGSALAGLNIGATGQGLPAISVQMLLASAQQTLMQEMETKIAGAIDAKLAQLSQRLAFSEQMIFKLHQRIDSADGDRKASVEQLEEKLASLESSLAALVKHDGADILQLPTE